MTFISQLYTGSISDREIIRRSGFLNLPFDDKDSIMADKGFTIQDLLPLGVSLNLPPFLEAKIGHPLDITSPQGSTLTGVLLLNMNFSYSIRATGSYFWPCSKYLEETGVGFISCSAKLAWFLFRLEIK